MAKLNRNYCKPDADMKPVFAPAAFRYNGKDYWHPEKEDFALIGLLPLSPDRPVDPPQGKHYERTDKIEANGADGWRWTYRLVDDPPPPPKVYSVNEAIYALMKRNVYEQCRQWMEQAGLRDLVLTTETFTEDMENFETIKNGLQQLLGYTDGQVAEVLAEAEVG